MTSNVLDREVPLPPEDKRVISEIREIPGLNNMFNAGAWLTTRGETMLLLRQVLEPGQPGQPDSGPLVNMNLGKPEDLIELELMGNNVINKEVVWHPEGKDSLLEDPRVVIIGDGRVMVGMTAVEARVPYPAITYLEQDSISKIEPSTVRIIRDFGPGKNMTPIDSSTFFFRQEKNHHKLLVLSWDENNDRIDKTGELEFPKDIDWASWRVGTGSPPIWINEREALMIFHGIKVENGLYVYSVGKAMLYKDDNGKYSLTHIDRTPLLHPDDFITKEDGSPLVPDLHPELRRVLYVCGHTLEGDDLSLFVNHGDSTTIPHGYSLGKMVEDLSRVENKV
ncbi:MAG: hypothetical protein WBB58_01920 [Microgenomates group bacterium]